MKATVTRMPGAPRMMTREALEMVAARFRAMGEPLRLKILQLLERGELSVSALAEAAEATQQRQQAPESAAGCRPDPPPPAGQQRLLLDRRRYRARPVRHGLHPAARSAGSADGR